jgi:hypothetical protein
VRALLSQAAAIKGCVRHDIRGRTPDGKSLAYLCAWQVVIASSVSRPR